MAGLVCCNAGSVLVGLVFCEGRGVDYPPLDIFENVGVRGMWISFVLIWE